MDEQTQEETIIQFAREIDDLTGEIWEKLNFDAVLEKAGPMMKMMGKDIGKTQVRTMIYQLVLGKPLRALKFLSWLNQKLKPIVQNTNYWPAAKVAQERAEFPPA